MLHGLLFRHDTGRVRLAPVERAGHPLELVVPYTNPMLTARALESATELARGFDARVTLMAVHVLPYPSPLESQAGIRARMESEMAAVAQTATVSICIKLVFARDRADAYLGLLPRQSLVVIGTRRRWWRTAEERLARRLTCCGHSVALVKVE